jgi:hypothetical protein
MQFKYDVFLGEIHIIYPCALFILNVLKLKLINSNCMFLITLVYLK